MYVSRSVSIALSVLTLGCRAATTLAKCNADNCYRALFPCPSPTAVSSASAFCATITANGITATNFPTRATSACGTAPARYISACACGPTCPVPTPTSTPCTAYGGLLTNGDFECGIAPWTIEVLDPNVKAGLTSASAHSGTTSFESKLLADRPLQEPVTSTRIKSPRVSVQRNVPCRLSFWVWFDNMDAGFIGVMIDGQPKRTIDARDAPGWGVWKEVTVDYTPQNNHVQVTFEFLYGRVASVARLDSVVLEYLH
ncbi:hypothetical protein CCHR01_12973 [Colletotrichum chrysophilum]|uniref:Uncharacterized protein n=1 Tax=Colletotrichum chrysophilum TaxID=1836956 RepID=A0AAD9AAA6_9PEZI|nr:hypothetical protein CCHR01_12973 [Colletotrichum chrysophilum]